MISPTLQAEVEKLRLRNTDVVEAFNATRSEGEDKASEETLILKELDNQEVSEEELDDFSFSGTSSCYPVLRVLRAISGRGRGGGLWGLL